MRKKCSPIFLFFFRKGGYKFLFDGFASVQSSTPRRQVTSVGPTKTITLLAIVVTYLEYYFGRVHSLLKTTHVATNKKTLFIHNDIL